MASWYYVDQGNNRTGPVPAESLAEAYRQGQVGTDSLVWREGMAEWAPLAGYLDELGLDRVRPAVAAPPPGTAPAKNKNGCLIIGIVVAVGGIFLVAVLAILAAIALPAYQDYIGRSQTAAALADIRPLVPEIESFYQNTGRCPRDADEIGIESSISGMQGRSTLVTVGEDYDGHCQVEGQIVGGHHAVNGVTLRLVRDEDGHWSCSTDFDRVKYLPTGCRVD